MLNFFIPHRLEGEKIILLVRRHLFVLAYKELIWILVAILPIILYWLLRETFDNLLPADLQQPLSVIFVSVYYLYIWLFIFFTFVDYYLDVWIVTNERIIDIEQRGLFARVVSEQKLYRVQDTTAEVKGFFPTVLNFGNVYIQSAAEKERFVFKQIPNPNAVNKKIVSLVEENKKFHHIIQ